MERYHILKEVGDGTFGRVSQAVDRQNGEVVAIKKMKKKYYSWEECLNLREVKSLRLMNHPNIVKLKEVIREWDTLHFVFEYMECNLYQLMNDKKKPFSETEVRNWCFQVFQGLAYIHQQGYFHRDLKPENLLVKKDVVKIADFGLAREISSRPPYTEYVSTRWYRAPEVLLQSPAYGSAVDMWAMGAMMAELFTLRPLFPGLSEADEIYKICSVIGSPTEESWAHGLALAGAMNYKFPQLPGVNLSLLIPSASKDAISLIRSLCSWDPQKRPTANEVLHHPFFQNSFYIPPPLRSRAATTPKPSSVGMSTSPEKEFAKNNPVSGILSNWNSRNQKSDASLAAGPQCALKMENPISYGEKFSIKHPKYQPPVMKCPYAVASLNTSQKTSNFAMSAHKQHSRQPIILRPPHMKAGGWHGQSDLASARFQGIRPNENNMKKITG